MSAFAKWYIGKLQTYPMRTNMATALVLMGGGDIMAQRIELMEDEKNDDVPTLLRRHSLRPEPEASQLSFRRYGTLSPDVDSLHKKQRLLRQQEEYLQGLSFSQFIEATQILSQSISNELRSLDFFRTGTMVVWAVAFYTPFFVMLYKAFDLLLPKRVTPMTVSARTGLSLLVSIPVNAAFFCYGSSIHHLTEWITLLQEWHYKFPDASMTTVFQEIPFDFEVAWSTARLKLEAELVRTMKASACFWIPINLVQFSVVPPHLRPLGLMVCSTFWNCYLSLAQHRPENL
jgi:hypothetical protein